MNSERALVALRNFLAMIAMNGLDHTSSLESPQPDLGPASQSQAGGVRLPTLASRRIANPLRILLIDENAFDRRDATILLEKMGHCVETAADAPSAVDHFAKREFDLVLIDLGMPTSDGFEVIKWFDKLQGVGVLPPFIALTARDQCCDRRKLLAAGMEDSLSKPLIEEEVRRLIPDVSRSPDRPPAWPNNPWSLAPETIKAAFPMSRSSMVVVVELFRESCCERLSRIRKALATGDRVELARNAHALKGSLAMFGSAMTLEILTDLERQPPELKSPVSNDLLEKLEKAIDSLEPTLEELLHEDAETKEG